MKNLKTLFTSICLTFIFANTLKAQDDPNAGWYADGVKVEKIDCYNFKKLELVIPYNAEWATYDNISIHVYYLEGLSTQEGIKLISTKAISGFQKGKYLVYSLFKPGDNGKSQNGYDNTGLMFRDPYAAKGIPDPDYFMGGLRLIRWNLKYESGKTKNKDNPAKDLDLNFDIYGLTQTAIKEEYNQSCNCIKKKPIYSSSKASQTYKLTCTNRVVNKIDPSNVEFSESCSYPGTKVDFNSIDK